MPIIMCFSNTSRPCILNTVGDQGLFPQFFRHQESSLSGSQGLGNFPVTFKVQILSKSRMTKTEL